MGEECYCRKEINEIVKLDKRNYKKAQKSLIISDKAFLINMATTYSPALWCSTIGHEGLNFSVRYGKR